MAIAAVHPANRPARRRQLRARAGAREWLRPGVRRSGAAPSESETESAQHLGEREQVEPHHVAIGAVDGSDERRSAALDGISAGLAVPFSARNVIGNFIA